MIQMSPTDAMPLWNCLEPWDDPWWTPRHAVRNATWAAAGAATIAVVSTKSATAAVAWGSGAALLAWLFFSGVWWQ